jgi:hypothetical protein
MTWLRARAMPAVRTRMADAIPPAMANTLHAVLEETMAEHVTSGPIQTWTGVVETPSPMEKHEASYLVCDGTRAIVWPKYILDRYVGKRVRVTIEEWP